MGSRTSTPILGPNWPGLILMLLTAALAAGESIHEGRMPISSPCQPATSVRSARARLERRMSTSAADIIAPAALAAMASTAQSCAAAQTCTILHKYASRFLSQDPVL